MKQIFALLIMCAAVMAFQVDTVTGFPEGMIAGSNYTAEYRFVNNVEAPYYAYVVVTDTACDEMQVSLEGGTCTCTEPNRNVCERQTVLGENTARIGISLVPNLYPTNYSISVSFSGVYEPSVVAENITINVNNSEVMINGEPMNETAYYGTLPIVVESEGEPILAFENNFSSSSINFSNVNITVGNVGGASFMQIAGVNASGGMVGTKTAYLQNASGVYDSICIRDDENTLATQMSSGCNATGEILVRCDGSAVQGYTCTKNLTTLKIEGLRHSTVLQTQSPPPHYVAPTYQGSGGNGGGPGIGPIVKPDKKVDVVQPVAPAQNKTEVPIVKPEVPVVPVVEPAVKNETTINKTVPAAQRDYSLPTNEMVTKEVDWTWFENAVTVIIILAFITIIGLTAGYLQERGKKKEEPPKAVVGV